MIEGVGTPAPVAPTEHLVVGGLYRYVRNPMYLAVVATILGQAALLGQPVLLVWARVAGAADVGVRDAATRSRPSPTATAPSTSATGARCPAGGRGAQLQVERGLALVDREAPLVERLADDHAGQVDLPQLGEPAQVVERADPARVQEPPAHGLGHARRPRPGRAPRACRRGPRWCRRTSARRGRPSRRIASRAGICVVCVQPEVEIIPSRTSTETTIARPEGAQDVVEEVDVAERRRADHGPLGAGAQRLAHRGQRAQPTAVLDRARRSR